MCPREITVRAPQRVAATTRRLHSLRECRSSFSTSSTAIIAVLARDEPWCACPRPPCPLALLILHHSSPSRRRSRGAPLQSSVRPAVRMQVMQRHASRPIHVDARILSRAFYVFLLRRSSCFASATLECIASARTQASLRCFVEHGPRDARGNISLLALSVCVCRVSCGRRVFSSQAVCAVVVPS